MKLGNNTFLKHLSKDNLPENNLLYWDTSLPATAIFNHPENVKRKASIAFIDRLVKEKTYNAISSILIEEFIIISVRNELKKSQGSRSRADKAWREGDEKIIQPHLEDIKKNIIALNDIIGKFGARLRIVLTNDPTIISKALALQCQYKLERADSIHIATMLVASQRDIACFDRNDFGKVDGLNIWCKY